ncbi:hypothetical protein A2Y85_02495 [candidate division WOR-3 bacterium RBG_13_43_14]|uniref:YhfC family intramembrane metalloprotease n=1 Tax=candidate division WOR-3 bacterium RBG_13_43_14 TaxID=1802590 RepID=A0A1F4UBT3_UNCW3|nr:MAG: hypothetical protein A2Y85_02495 [candidate division WOR-3 bacterium RBG_13_43_14]
MIGLLISGLLVIFISIGFIVWTKRKYNYSMRWIWVGGGIWVTGVALKFGFAIAANEPVLAWLQQILEHPWYLAIGSVYIGALTGVFEIGITLLLALLVKKMSDDPAKAIGIGIGAGAIEALLIGLSQIGNLVYLMTGGQGMAEIMSSLTQTVSLNPLFFLLAPVERVIAIICHTGSRVLTLYAVAHKNYLYFVVGFLIMTGIDAVAGFVHLAGLMSQISTWWIELSILPFALVSIPLIKWCIKRWPQTKV